VRKLAGQRRVGHAGTLDPMATGVLLVCLGEATRLSELLMGGTKWYLARVAFGVQTETDDAKGAVVATAVPAFSRADLLAALAAQVGALLQTPPAYAAIKQAGVPAYKKARAGAAVTLAPRAVTVYATALLSASLPAAGSESGTPAAVSADLLISCSKGTYIRAIARDLGAALGCGAHLAGLRRIASGGFTVRDCVSPAALEDAVAREGAAAMARFVQPAEQALAGIPACVLSEALARRVAHGLTFTGPPYQEGSLRVYGDTGALLALARSADVADWHADRVFAAWSTA
jgi:tRNA pseudouridine55 synthase